MVQKMLIPLFLAGGSVSCLDVYKKNSWHFHGTFLVDGFSSWGSSCLFDGR